MKWWTVPKEDEEIDDYADSDGEGEEGMHKQATSEKDNPKFDLQTNLL